MKIHSLLSLLPLSLLLCAEASAEVRLPVLLSNGMILQRDRPATLHGWASPGRTVTLSFLQNVRRTVAAADSTWSITLPPQQAGGPYSLEVACGNRLTIDSLFFGDLWLCSGQSNMETPVSRVMTLFGNEIRNYSNPRIRYVKIPLAYNFHGAQSDVPPCTWSGVTPESAQTMAALPYFFAREMYERTGIPVGIINASVGGSPAEAWLGEEALAGYPALLNDMRICRSDQFIADMQRYATLPGKRWHEVLNAEDPGLREAWASPALDDDGWTPVDLFDAGWGRSEGRPRNGSHWFRREINVPPSMTGRDAMLYLGRIADADFVYLNGELVGSTGYQYPPRNYPLKAGSLKPGRNLLAIRLISQGGFPEFVAGKTYEILSGTERINLEGKWKYRIGAQMPFLTGGGVAFQNKPAGLFNAMIAPLSHFAFTGAIWYQGESNTANHAAYRGLMTSMIQGWRSLLKNNPELPFIIVQLPNYMQPEIFQPRSDWAELREVQRQLAQTIPHTALAVAIDLGEANDIHPLNKKDLAHRIALQARRHIYGEAIVSEGPMFESFRREGNRLILSFREGSDDLQPDSHLKGFALAGSDGVFHPAEAAVEGRKVIVWRSDLPDPEAVCYAWANNPEGASLRNRSGLPASPFRAK